MNPIARNINITFENDSTYHRSKKMIPLGVLIIVYLSFNRKFSTNDFICNINT